jgi:hypothetical protein
MKNYWRGMAVLAVLIAVASALVCIGPADAGGYCNQSYYSTYTPTYQAPSYQQVQYVTKYVDREVLAPYPVKAYINPDYYFSTQDYYRDKLLVDAMAGRTVQLLQGGGVATPPNAFNSGFQMQTGQQVLTPQQLQTLIQQLQGGQQQPVQPTTPAPGTAPLPQAPAMPPAAAGPGKDWRECWYANGTDQPDPALTKAVSENCLKCHGGTNPDRMDLRDLSRISFVGRSLVKSLVDDGSMPKNAHPLDNNTAALFQPWFQTGYRASVAKK